MIAARLGFRNLARNRWRSGLTLGAVAVAVMLMVWTIAFYEGWLAQMVRGATAIETSHVQVHRTDYVEAPRTYRSFALDPALITAIENTVGVLSVTPRVELNGLVGNETRSQVSRIIGVDPEREVQTSPVAEGIVDGRWLADADDVVNPAVLGHQLARQLQVGVGDELVVFLEAADGSLGNDLLQVVGLLRTGDTRVDRATIYTTIEDAQFIAALDDHIHELAILTDDAETAPAAASAVRALVVDDGTTLSVRPWQSIVPGVNAMIVLFRRSYWVMYLLIYLIAAIGVLNTQRMAALERRREFGVMIAIGMRPRRMLRTLVIETAVLGVVGAVIGATLGGLLAWYHTVAGFDLSMFTDQASFTYMGVAFSERIHFVMSPSTVFVPVLVMTVVSLLSGLWPGVQASRVEPGPTISGRMA